MRTPAWRRILAVNGAILALAALGAVAAHAAESTTTTTTTGDRAWLGVYTQSLSSELRESMNYKGTGVLVNRVIDGSPADKAGLKDGDIITSCNSRSVDSPDALSGTIGQAKVGQSVALKIVRDGKTQTLNAKLAARPDEDEMGEDDHGGPGHRMHHFEFDMPDVDMMPGMVRVMGHGRLGVRIESLNPDLGSYFSVPDGKGVLVTEVLKSTAAEKAGLKAGDVITKVGDKTVADSDDLMRALGDSEGKVTLAIVRKGQKKTVDADLGESPRVMTLRHGGDVERLRSNPDQQRQIDELKRQIDELKRQIDSMKH